jgi:hypothetical protein
MSVVKWAKFQSMGFPPQLNKLHRIPDHPSTRAIKSWLAIGNPTQTASLDSEIPLFKQGRACFVQLQGTKSSIEFIIFIIFIPNNRTTGILASRDLRVEDEVVPVSATPHIRLEGDTILSV